ncbi:MAG: hypothetical protein RMJ67_07720 [Elusimicrobiota bacterium]|nr:hypothetical protein [Endomicrobiia bacterium]MDW8166380.1 hypothetical protein [Elusimicrobiota bacterium]
MATVWIVNKRNHNYKDAEKFGKLEVLTAGKMNIFRANDLVKDVINKLANKTSPNDLIVLSGYIIANSIVIHYFLKKYGKANLLVWDANNNKYVKIHLSDFAV